MTDKEIVALAKECGFWGVDGWFEQSVPRFRLMIESAWNAATQAERESCASLIENIDDFGLICKHDMAALIRARTE